MSETSTAEQATGTSPARQMLAALSQASKDMTTKFGEVSERAAKLNAVLDGDVNKSLEEINQLSELILQAQLSGLSAEKDAMLAELTVLRQQELKVLNSIAKNLKDSLTEKLNELMAALKDEVKEQLIVFQRNIGQTEAEVIRTEKSIRQSVRDNLPLQLESIQNKVAAEKKDLESLQFRNQGLLAQEAKQSQEKLYDHGTKLKGRLVKEQAEYLEAIEVNVREIVDAQTQKLEKRLQEFATLHEKAKSQLNVNMDFLEKTQPSFTEACRQLSELKLEMHQSTVNNLALVYRSEILTLAQETEDKLVVVRANLRSALRKYHEHYSEQSSALLAKFEEAAKAAKPALTDAQKMPEEEEIPVELFDKLRKEIKKMTKELVTTAETSMEQSYSDFRSRLSGGSQNACAAVESTFHDCRKKIVELAETHKEELEELSHKGDALEQLVSETKELVGALDPSNLEF
jgi:DNA repair exonuclease SbcCD ATPase subunit